MKRLLALALLALAPPTFAQAPARPQVDRVDAVAAEAFERQHLVGMAVVVFDREGIAWSKGYGLADREGSVPVDPAATQFRWASISKPVTAVAALQLAERGRLDLDADVRRYVPEFPDKGETVTVRQLLCHQGGIVHYANGPVVRAEKSYDDPHPFAESSSRSTRSRIRRWCAGRGRGSRTRRTATSCSAPWCSGPAASGSPTRFASGSRGRWA